MEAVKFLMLPLPAPLEILCFRVRFRFLNFGIFCFLFQLRIELVGGDGGTTLSLPRDGGAEELRGDPTVGPHPKVWTIGQE